VSSNRVVQDANGPEKEVDIPEMADDTLPHNFEEQAVSSNMVVQDTLALGKDVDIPEMADDTLPHNVEVQAVSSSMVVQDTLALEKEVDSPPHNHVVEVAFERVRIRHVGNHLSIPYVLRPGIPEADDPEEHSTLSLPLRPPFFPQNSRQIHLSHRFLPEIPAVLVECTHLIPVHQLGHENVHYVPPWDLPFPYHDVFQL